MCWLLTAWQTLYSVSYKIKKFEKDCVPIEKNNLKGNAIFIKH